MPPFVPPSTTSNVTPGVGKHFEAYYNIMSNAPAIEERLVPFAGGAAGGPSFDTVTWSSIHPSTAVASDLLDALRLNLGRTLFERILCPPGGF